MFLVSNVVCLCALQHEDAFFTITPKLKSAIQHVLPKSNSAKGTDARAMGIARHGRVESGAKQKATAAMQ